MIEPLQSDDVLLADIASAPRAPGLLHLWWLGQSGFLAQSGDYRLLFDPYLSDSLTKKYSQTTSPHERISRRTIDPARLTGIRLITSTHNHTDHLDAESLLPVLSANPEAPIALSAANVAFAAERLKVAPSRLRGIKTGESFMDRFHADELIVSTIPSAHDRLDADEQGNHRYIGFIAKINGFTIYHSGDGVVWDGQVRALSGVKPDIAILPVNGKVGNMNGADAARLARDIGAKLVIPCHYDMFGFNTADPKDQFVPECERLGQPYKVLRLGERLSIAKETQL